jgi:hypothetical protein
MGFQPAENKVLSTHLCVVSLFRGSGKGFFVKLILERTEVKLIAK